MWHYLFIIGLSWFSILLLVDTFAQTPAVMKGQSISQLYFSSFPSCQQNFTFDGLRVDSNLRLVRSEMDCAVLCSKHPKCAAYNSIRIIAGRTSKDKNICELLLTSPSSCNDLVIRPLSKFKYETTFQTRAFATKTTTAEFTTEDESTTEAHVDTTVQSTTEQNIDTTVESTPTTTEIDATTTEIDTTTTEIDTTTTKIDTTTTEQDTTTTEMDTTTTEQDTTTTEMDTTTTEIDSTTTEIDTTTTEQDTTTTEIDTTTTEMDKTTTEIDATTTEIDTTTTEMDTTTTEQDTTTTEIDTTTTEMDTTTTEIDTTTTEMDKTTTEIDATTTEIDTTTTEMDTTTTEQDTTTTEIDTTTTEIDTTTTEIDTTTTEIDTTTTEMDTTTTEIDTTTTEQDTTTAEIDTTTQSTTETTEQTTTTTGVVPTQSANSQSGTTTDAVVNWCDQSWTLVYQTENDGKTSRGNLNALRHQLEEGASVVLMMTHGNSGRTFMVPGHQFDMTSNLVCAHLPFFVNAASSGKLTADSEWWFIKACTSGTIEINTASNSPTTKSPTVNVKWYYRPNTCTTKAKACNHQNPLLTNEHNGKVSQGSVKDLINDVQQGFGVNVLLGDTKGNGGSRKDTDNSLYLSQTVVMLNKDDHLGALNIWSFVQSNSKSDPYLELRLSATDGDDNTIGWSLEKHKDVEKLKKQNSQHSWFVDSCWEKIYSNGNRPFGSHDDLLAAVRTGHRVKVTVSESQQTLYVEADHLVIIAGGVVIAQILSNVVTEDKDLSIDKDGLWSWYFVHSNGRQCQHLVTISELKEKSASCRDVITEWFVDKRQYDVALETDVKGNVIAGSKRKLWSAVSRVAQMTVKVDIPSDNGFSRYMTIDTAEVGQKTEVSATSMRILRSTLGKDGIMRLHNTRQGMALLVTSEGRVYTQHWTVGFLDAKSVQESSASVTWFVSK